MAAVCDTHVVELCKTHIKMPEIGQLVGANETTHSGSSLGTSVGRKSVSAFGTLTKSFTKNKSISKKFTKKASAVDNTLNVKNSDKSGPPTPEKSFKVLAFMNRSNTALENLFQKKYLEPEVYGKSREGFMEKPDTADPNKS